MLIVDQNRIRLWACPEEDALKGRETTKSLAELQYLDLVNVGIVMLSLLCRQQIPAHGIQQALGYLSSRVSVPLFNAFTFIFSVSLMCTCVL
jgi:hypothetical protein